MHVRDILEALYDELQLGSGVLKVASSSFGADTEKTQAVSGGGRDSSACGVTPAGDERVGASTIESSVTGQGADVAAAGASVQDKGDMAGPAPVQYGIFAEEFCHLFKADALQIRKLQDFYQ